MLLADILHLLHDEIEDLDYTNRELYELLFCGAESPSELNIEETVKKLFSNSSGRRSLSGEMTKQFRSRKGFLDFSDRIETHYLSKVNYQNGNLYEKLCVQIRECPYLPEHYKKKLLESFEPNSSFHLAELIACCIILGNYNTRQTKAKKPCIKNDYKLSLRFMGLSDCCREISYPMTDRIWDASQRSFQYSHEKGNRFHSLDIIRRLLPKGYLSDHLLHMRGETIDGNISPIMELCTQNPGDIVVIGEGGIGKTTFLQQILTDHFTITKNGTQVMLPYRQGIQIPIFVELNRCPAMIGEWYEPVRQKTNFITRYVAQMLENHLSLDAVDSQTLTLLEKEFQRTPVKDVPEYLLLLDGFNEVSTEASARGKSVRSYLNDEISVLHTYRNVRIITTSRETQTSAFMQHFQNIRLLGLEDSDITTHLSKCGMKDTAISITMANKQLVTCLRVPLFLCMFASEYQENELLPETSGEILYFFFHRNSAFYNARQRFADTRTNPLNMLETAVVLDFILPYIGWRFENSDAFSMSATDFREAVCDSLQILSRLFLNGKSIPFEDFQYDSATLEAAIHTLYGENSMPRTEDILDCIHTYLGILYHYSDAFADSCGQSRFAFIHHHFRDYFSSVFDIQLLRMLPCLEASSFCRTEDYRCFLNYGYWRSHKAEFISQILMEHRNRPTMDTLTGNWTLPSPAFPEQAVLANALDFCRALAVGHTDIHYLLQNILSAIVTGREELSGMDLSDLDFQNCNLFGIPCSKKGATKYLAADFNRSSLYPDCFEPAGHLDDVIEYIYRGNHCYSLDLEGTIKCWDVLSGRLEYTLHSDSPAGLRDFSSRGYMKITANEHWLAVKVQPEIPTEEGAHAALFHLSSKSDVPVFLIPPEKSQLITAISFTEDMQHLLLLADRNYLCCFHIPDGSLEYAERIPDFMKHTEIYAADAASPVYAFTSEYNEFELDEEASYLACDEDEIDDNMIDIDADWEEYGCKLEIPCALLRWEPSAGKTEELYSFVSTPGTLPTAAYFHSINCFLLYNHATQQLEKFDCDFLLAEPVWESITRKNGMPFFVLPYPGNPKECYLMYPDVCYEMDLCSEQDNGIIMAYHVGPMNQLLTEYEADAEEGLRFQMDTAPSGKRVLVRSDRTVYEWNTDQDSLTPRYNSIYYGCAGLIADLSHDRSILVHQCNGISVFEGRTPKLAAAYCFPYTDYYVENCAYHEETQQLALCFCRPGHEFIKVLSLKDSSSRIVFSCMNTDFIEDLNFHPDGLRLLICTYDECLEYEFASDTTYPVAVHEPGDNEAFVGADYAGDEIEIAVVARKAEQENTVRSRCDYYRRYRLNGIPSYQRKWGYYVPLLTPELAKFFVHRNQDMGVGGAYHENGIQSYWLTHGFFKDKTTAISDFLTVECFEYKKQGRRKLSARQLGLFQFLYVQHDFSIDNRQRVGGTHYCYSYLSQDFSRTVCIRDYEELYYWKDLKKEPKRWMLFDYKEDDSGHAYWDFAIPAGGDRLLCCFENYHLAQVDTDKGQIYDEIPYTPGIAVCGCRFKNIKADPETKELLRNNGGLVI